MTATDRRAEVRPGLVGSEQADPSSGRLRVRRQPKWIAAGVLAMCLGGLGSALLYTEASRSSDVIVVTRNVARGEVVQEADLRVARVGNLTGVSSVTASQINTLFGKRALVDLTENALLPAGGIGDPVLADGGAQLGLKLAPGRVPNADLAQGAVVQLVPLEDPRVASSDTSSGVPAAASIPATVLTPPTTGPDGVAILLDVQVDSDVAATVAALAAADRIALVKEAS